MTLLDMVLVALITGLTEVLPLDSAAHLALLRQLSGITAQHSVAIAAADCGIALALAVYLWRDLLAMAVGVWRLVKGRQDAGGRLFLQLLSATVPAIGLGWLFTRYAPGQWGAVMVTAAMAVFGLFLLVADKLGMTVRRLDHLSLAGAVAIGALQAAALIPGVSRVGITVTAARLMGYERPEAARLGLLLSLPLLAWSAGGALWQMRGQLVLSSDFLTAAAVGFAAALAACFCLMGWLHRHGFSPFALWRILVGGAALAWAIHTGI